ncbi:MAG: N-acetyltransferase [Clostridiales bacterium]|nr:N-acetyltransferase [Clostridiales bacterium]
MELNIRPMERGDWPEAVEILYQSIQTNNDTFLLECPDFDQWDVSNLPDCRLVMEDDYSIVGWASLSSVSPLEAYKGVASVSIYLDAEHREKDSAVSLLSALVEESEKAGYWLLESEIFESNHPKLSFFEKCSFRRVGTRERVAKDRFGVWRSLVLMERRIQTDKAGGCDCDMIKQMQGESCSGNPESCC